MSKKDHPTIEVVSNGPLVIKGIENMSAPSGEPITTRPVMALCRCGASEKKPLCDGTHSKIGWTEDKKPDRQPDRVDTYEGKKIVIHDNRGVCSHAGFCTDGLPKVWRMKTEPWIDPDGAEPEEIIEIIKKCPSGALSYSIDGVLHNTQDRNPGIHVAKDGPYVVVGAPKLDTHTDEASASTEHYALCRCGESKNKPFCDGSHYYVEFKDGGDVNKEAEQRPDAPTPTLDQSKSPPTPDHNASPTKLDGVAALAATGKSDISAMGTRKSFPNWDSIVFKGAQLARMPLNEDETVNTKTVIGNTADHPLEIEMPFYVSHMSFGALSRETKIALARGSRLVGTMMCSGEGGMLPQEREEAARYVYELGTACFSHKDDAIRQADATEIKIGQAAKPGLGGHLPKGKITAEIAEIRGIKLGEDSISPGRHSGIDSLDDLKREVDHLRELTAGKPVGIKFSAGHVEADIAFALEAKPDFITIDCRGGATGAAPTFLKDNVCIPPIYAIHRARKALDAAKSSVTLCVTGGFRDSADIAKALAMGADAVALATASMVAVGCQQARVCQTGQCPVGIATQDPGLRQLFDIDLAVERFVNFYNGTREELKHFARTNGHDDVHMLDLSDILTLSDDVARYTDIEHV